MLAAAGIQRLLALVAGILVARALGPAGRGEWAALLLCTTMVYMVGQLGLPTAHLVLASREPRRLGTLWSHGLLHALVVGALSWVAALLLVRLVPDTLRTLEVRPALLLWILPTAALMLARDHALFLLQSRRRILALNLVAIGGSLVFLLGVAVGLWVLAGGLASLVAAWWAMLGVAVVAGHGTLAALAADRPRRPEVRFLGRSLPMGVSAWIADLVQWLHYRSDLFLLMVLTTGPEVGFYAVAVALAEAVWFLSRSLYAVLLPALGESEEAELRHRVERASRVGLVVGAAGGLLVAALGGPFLRHVYGEAFLPALPPLLGLLPGTVLLGTARAFSARYLAIEAPEVNARIAGVGLAINLLLNLALIPPLGPLGAALATSVSYSLMWIAYLVLYRRVTGSTWTRLLVPDRGDLAYARRVLSLGSDEG